MYGTPLFHVRNASVTTKTSLAHETSDQVRLQVRDLKGPHRVIHATPLSPSTHDTSVTICDLHEAGEALKGPQRVMLQVHRHRIAPAHGRTQPLQRHSSVDQSERGVGHRACRGDGARRCQLLRRVGERGHLYSVRMKPRAPASFALGRRMHFRPSLQ